ncbi:MAG: choice-of-anchor D domain-containing protein, partial [bacterium]
TTLNVRIKNSSGSVMWSGTVSSDGSGNVASTATWTIDYSAASGLYTIAVESPKDGQYYDYDDFTVVQLMEPEINVVGNSVTIADGDVSPSTSDDTDFATIDLNTGTRDHIFTIQNIGNTDLTLTGSPIVSIGGTHASDFTVTQQPTSPVSSGNYVTFTVRFDPSDLGLRTATISIDNNDSNEHPYNFAIQGTGALLPEMDVTGNDISIADGDNTPNSTDETYFGDVATTGVTQVHTFIIENYGSADLILSGSPLVSISGDHASDFTVTRQPTTPVTSGNNTSFVITFDPSALGSRTATVSIANNDLDEDPYTFAIEGTGVSDGTPFTCFSRFYHFYGSGTFAYVNTGSNPFTYSTFGSAGYAINAVGYNQEDGMMYANSGSSLIRIDASGVVTVLSITNPFASNAGDCDNSGNYYFISTGGNQVAKYDVSANTISTSGLSGSFPAQDMAFISGSFYGVNGTTLYQFNPSGNSVSGSAVTGTLADESGLNGSIWSAAWSAGDGYLYVVNQSSHRFYKIDVSTGLSFYAGTGSGGLSNSDGASCHSASSPMPDNGSAGNFVWQDYNNNGIQDTGEPGLENVTITLYRRGGTQVASTTSASDGSYSFSGIDPEQYYLTFTDLPADYSLGAHNQGGDDSADSDPDPSTGQTSSFIINAYETDNTRDAACITTGVGDFVWNDQDGDGIQDSGEPGVANVTVDLLNNNGNVVATTTTDANGHYEFIGITATRYQLEFSNLPGGYAITTQDAGGDDTIDSDPSTNQSKTSKFDLTANIFNPTYDAGLVQTVFPEINVQGNSTNIVDGDTTPSATDDTDFGSATVASGAVDHTFTIQNTGSVDLSVSVSITGSHASEFTIISAPLSPVSSGNSTTFTVRFDPDSAGIRTATISITNNDQDENPYDFAIQGTGLAPEIDVQGNSVSISDGDTSPDAADDTEFGTADINTGSVTHTFTIENQGTSDLKLTGTPIVQLSGAHASDFSVSQQPASSTISSGGTVTFQITFDPSTTGLREANISIANSDSDENPYNFSIQGTGTSGPEMDVLGNGVSIADGDVTPSTADSTNFGTVNIAEGTVSHTYTIENSGYADLLLTGSPIVAISGGTDFSVSTQPSASTISSGNTVTFVVSFNPASIGVQTATISIDNNDVDENPYTFTVQAEGVTEPEMDILGNGVEITDGDNTPSTTDDTDWSQVNLSSGAVTHTFTIRNEGNADLSLTGTPLVDISGSSDFTISTQPASSTVSAEGGTETFVISFNPSSTGVKSATVSISNNDPDEHPYTFEVQGEGVSLPELTLTKAVDKNTAEPGEVLTYTITYSNAGSDDATNIIILEAIPANTTYVTNSASGAGMTIEYSHDGGSSFDTSQAAPVTHVSFTRSTLLIPGDSGIISLQVTID